MATTIKGPAIFLAQFAGDAAPFDDWKAITRWAGSLGYKGVQVPSNDRRLFDLARAAESKTYCDEIAGIAAESGVAITELSTHLQGQLVAVHPAYDEAFDGFAPADLRGNPVARQRFDAPDRLFFRAGRVFRVDCDPPQLVQADGELVGTTPFDVEIDEGAVMFLVPRGRN